MKKLLLCLMLTSSMNVFSDLSQKDETLISLVYAMDLEAVKEALANGADINARGFYDQTALHTAARAGCTDIAQLLLANGADINATDNRKKTPLFWAEMGGWEAGFRDEEAELRDEEAELGDHIDTIQLLLDHDAKIDAIDSEGRTVFHSAAGHGCTDIAQLLLANGADINAQDKRGETALHRAAIFGQIAMAQLLLKNGADINATDQYSETALYKAIQGVSKGGCIKIVELLLDHGVDVNTVISEKKQTPLMFAVNRREKEIVRLLLDRGANRNAKDSRGKTAFDYAREAFDIEIARLLEWYKNSRIAS